MPVIREEYHRKRVSDLIPYPTNPRVHSDFQIRQLAKIIERVGYIDDIIIDESDMILAGHGRAMAAMKLSMEMVPCKKIFGLNDAEKKAYVIADNSLALNSSWDSNLLKENFDDIISSGEFDVSALENFGFSDNEIELYDLNLSPKKDEFNFDPPEDRDPLNVKDKDLVLTVTFETPESQEELFLELRDRGFKVKI